MRSITCFLLLFPALLQAQATFDSLSLLSSHIVYFNSGRHELLPEADSVLQQINDLHRQKPGLKMHLTAHTDAVGSDQNNKGLSERRANSVRSALLTLGLPDSLLVIETFGESTPIANNTDEDGRRLNRRVTIDVYQARRMRYLEGHIKDESTGEGIQADIVLRGKNFRDSLTTDTSGRFRHPVPDNEVIGADVYAKDHFFQSRMFKAVNGVALDMILPPAKKGKAADIDNLYFVGDQAVLLPQSEPELPKVLRFMQINAGLRIEIAGHINQPNQPPVPRDSRDWQLSVARAKLVYDYLIENGVNPGRISYKGYGNTQMRYPNARTEQEQALNRRVEIRVIEVGFTE